MPSSSPGRSVTIASACGRSVVRPGLLDSDGLGRMDLVHGRELGAGQHRGDRAPAVLVDRGAVVVAAVADVEPGELAGRNAAAAPEEAVREAAEARRANDFDAAHSACRMMMSSSAWSPTMNSYGPTASKP